MRTPRKSGILLHPTSLPGSGGIGSLGAEASAFIDFLAASGQSLWQVLPLGPTGHGNSPYSCYSAFAGNPLLVNFETLVEEGDLAAGECEDSGTKHRIDFPRVQRYKSRLLLKAADTFLARDDDHRHDEFRHFRETTPWLQDFALFMALKDHFSGACWNDWPADIRTRSPHALIEYAARLAHEVNLHCYSQWQFFRQWHRVKKYANHRGVEIIGDIPIFVACDSADVWSNPSLFKLDELGDPTVVAGVPPDYFSATGQLWGNPLYDWEALAQSGYAWWIERLRSSFGLYDIIRIDHFRGFAACWEVPAGEATAVNGQWVDGPGEALFEAVEAALGKLPIIAEDLGVITPDVLELRDRFGFPGMKILHFAFDSGPDNPYLPHNIERSSVIYTGTHDNDTTVGWYSRLTDSERQRILHYLDSPGKTIAWDLIRAALASVADTAIIPLQDVLSLGSEAKMNAPGTVGGNWSWRYQAGDLNDGHAARLLDLTEIYGRLARRRHAH